MLSIIQAFAEHRRQQLGGGTFLFLIDEGELHLHPSAQRALKRALLDVCETDQVLVNTHSSVLVTDPHEQQSVYRVEKESGATSITELDDLGLADVIYELLGGSPADLLLPRNFLIVEGKSEFEFLRKMIDRFYADELRGIKVLFGGGDLVEQEATLQAVHKVLVPLTNDNPIYRDKVVVLIDKPNDQQQNNYNLFKQGYPYLFETDRVFELPVGSIEEYYPEPHRKSAEEAKALGREKVPYAREVGENISKDDFEGQMSILSGALKKCAELAFGS